MTVTPPADIVAALDPVIYKISTNLLDSSTITVTLTTGDHRELPDVTTDLILSAPFEGTIELNVSEILQARLRPLQFDEYVSGYLFFSLSATGFTDTIHTAVLASTQSLHRGSTLQDLLATNPTLHYRLHKSSPACYYRSELSRLYGFVHPDELQYTTVHLLVERYIPGRPGTGGQWRTSLDSDLGTWPNDDYGFAYYDTPLTSESFWRFRVTYTATNSQTGVQKVVSFYVLPDPVTDEVYALQFLSSLGTFETILISGELSYVPKIDNPDIYIEREQYLDIRKMQRRSAHDAYSLQTAHLNAAQLALVVDMLRSDYVLFHVNGKYVQCAITTEVDIPYIIRQPQSLKLNIEIL